MLSRPSNFYFKNLPIWVKQVVANYFIRPIQQINVSPTRHQKHNISCWSNKV